jgi:outer membrane protein TolC
MKRHTRLRVLVLAGLGSLLVAGSGTASAAPAFPDTSKPLDVAEAVRIALERNYTVLQAAASVRIAEGSKGLSLAALFPVVSTGASLGRSAFSRESSSNVSSTGTPQSTRSEGDVRSRSWDVNVSQSLVSLRDWSNLASSRAALDAARHGQRATEQDIALLVKQQFYTVVRSEHLLGVAVESLTLAENEHRRVQSLFDLGSVAKSDLLKAQVNVSQSELAEIEARNTLDIERSRLATVLGLPPALRLRIVDDLAPGAPPPDSATALATALSARPDVRSAEASFRSAKLSLRAARAARLPDLSAQLGYSWGRSTAFDLLFDREISPDITQTQRGWNGSLALSLTLGDALWTRGQVTSALGTMLTRRHELDDLTNQVGLEVKEAYLSHAAAQKQIAASETGLAAAEEDLKVSQERYQVGLATILELIDAQVALARAKSDHVNAQSALKLAEAAVDRALGRPVRS